MTQKRIDNNAKMWVWGWLLIAGAAGWQLGVAASVAVGGLALAATSVVDFLSAVVEELESLPKKGDLDSDSPK